MTNSLEMLLSVSLSGGILALVLLALRPLLKDRLGKKWQYYIWIIVALRLLLPFSPEVSISGAIFSAFSEQTAQYTSQTAPLNPSAPRTFEAEQAGKTAREASASANSNAAEISVNESAYGSNNNSTPPKADLYWLFGAMLTGTAAMAAWKFIGYILLMKKLRRGSSQPEYHTQRLYYSLCKELGIKRPPALVSTDVTAPMLAGLFRPIIALPRGAHVGLKQILLHELIHYNRKDTLYKLCFEAALCLHWFNPAIWLAARRMGRDCELACDETVMEISGEGYGEVLLSFARSRAPKNALCLSEGGKIMKERLQAVKNFAKGKKRPVFIIAVVTAAIIACAVFMGAAKPRGGQELRFSTATVSNGGELKVEDSGVQGVLYSTSQPSMKTTIKTYTDKIKHGSASESDSNTKDGGEPIYNEEWITSTTSTDSSYNDLEALLREFSDASKPSGELFYSGSRPLFVAQNLDEKDLGAVFASLKPSDENKNEEQDWLDLGRFLKYSLFENPNLNTKGTQSAGLLAIPDGYLFNSGEDDIRDGQAEEMLQSIADVLKKYEDRIEHITVSGHTDNNPINTEEFPDNFDLSSKRANNIVRFLAEAGDLDPILFDSLGRGEWMPIATNDTPEGRQQNRRVEILVECKN